MAELVRQPDGRPTRKVERATIVGAVLVLVAFVYARATGEQLPPDVVAALTTLAVIGAAYLTRERASSTTVPPAEPAPGPGTDHWTWPRQRDDEP